MLLKGFIIMNFEYFTKTYQENTNKIHSPLSTCCSDNDGLDSNYLETLTHDELNYLNDINIPNEPNNFDMKYLEKLNKTIHQEDHKIEQCCHILHDQLNRETFLASSYNYSQLLDAHVNLIKSTIVNNAYQLQAINSIDKYIKQLDIKLTKKAQEKVSPIITTLKREITQIHDISYITYNENKQLTQDLYITDEEINNTTLPEILIENISPPLKKLMPTSVVSNRTTSRLNDYFCNGYYKTGKNKNMIPDNKK